MNPVNGHIQELDGIHITNLDKVFFSSQNMLSLKINKPNFSSALFKDRDI